MKKKEDTKTHNSVSRQEKNSSKKLGGTNKAGAND
jgi:hypothetical protein